MDKDFTMAEFAVALQELEEKTAQIFLDFYNKYGVTVSGVKLGYDPAHEWKRRLVITLESPDIYCYHPDNLKENSQND